MSQRLVVVTGGAGFLGEHVARALTAGETHVRLLDSADPPEWVAAAGLEFVRGDIRDRNVVETALMGASAVVHAAFASPRQPADTIRAVNVEGTRNVRDAMVRQQVPRLVLVSSTIVTGPPRRHPLWPRSPLGRLDLYRTTRMEAERILSEHRASGFSSAIVRPQSFVGPGRLGAFGIIFELIMNGDPVPVLGDGRHRYQLLAVQDLAHGIQLLTSSESQGVFAFGASPFSTVRADLEALLSRVHSTSKVRSFPAGMSRAGLRALELAGFVPLSEWHRHSAWGRDSIADTTRANDELGWVPQRGNVDALVDAYDWYAATIRASGAAPRTHALPRTHAALRQFLRILPGS